MFLEAYCEVVSQTVEVEYHSVCVPILNAKHDLGSFQIDACTCGDDCCVSTSGCPIFKKLNNL